VTSSCDILDEIEASDKTLRKQGRMDTYTQNMMTAQSQTMMLGHDRREL